MINYIKRKDLNVAKYDACVEKSIQSRVYAFSWYLDITADNWDVLVMGDYNAVMPIPFRKKYFIRYVYPPFWLLELGIFSLNEKVEIQGFFDVLLTKFKYIEIKLNIDNFIKSQRSFFKTQQMQLLNIDQDHSLILKKYRNDRKKDLRKADNENLIEKWDNKTDTLIKLFKDNVGKRTPFIKKRDYHNLKMLINTCISKNAGEILSVYDKQGLLVASGFFLKHKNTISILVSSTDFNNRKNGANTFLIDRAISKYQKKYKMFNFGGSSIESIANYFLSFGAETYHYQQVYFNKLPLLLKLFKK